MFIYSLINIHFIFSKTFTQRSRVILSVYISYIFYTFNSFYVFQIRQHKFSIFTIGNIYWKCNTPFFNYFFIKKIEE